MTLSDVVFAIFGLPSAFVKSATAEARHLRSRWSYRRTSFGRGAIASGLCKFEEHVSVQENAVVVGSKVGAYTYIGRYSVVWMADIGRYCSIGPEVRIGLGTHPMRGYVSTYPGFYSSNPSIPGRFTEDDSVLEHQKVTIGSDVWIGARAMLMDGVTIGHGAVIGAGAVVTKSIGDYCVAVGVPARVVRMRFDPATVAQLLAFAWWDRGPEFCHMYANSFRKPEQFLGMAQAGCNPDGVT